MLQLGAWAPVGRRTEFLENYLASRMRDNSMALHLVGETIDAKRAYQRAKASELIQLLRGVFVDN